MLFYSVVSQYESASARRGVQDYMVYWARMTGKGSEIGRLQRWLLADVGRAARICNPFSACGHSYLLRSRSAVAEAVRLTVAADNVNIDPVLTATIKDLVASPPNSGLEPEVRAGFATVLASAALDLRMFEQVRLHTHMHACF